MKNLLIVAIVYVVMSLLYTIVLWQISKKRKLKIQDFKTALEVIGIYFIFGLVIFLISQLITFPISVKVLLSIFTFILIPLLIKKFYNVGLWKAVKIYLLTFLIVFCIMFIIFFIISFLMVIITPFLK